jgi:hypothetical protein
VEPPSAEPPFAAPLVEPPPAFRPPPVAPPVLLGLPPAPPPALGAPPLLVGVGSLLPAAPDDPDAPPVPPSAEPELEPHALAMKVRGTKIGMRRRIAAHFTPDHSVRPSDVERRCAFASKR